MDHTTAQSAHCTNHPILPGNQALYLFNALIDRARYLEFDETKYRRADWDAVTDSFNARYEGKRLPGSARRQTEKTAVMLHCAFEQNIDEFSRLWYEAKDDFLAKKREDAGGEQH